MIKMKNKTRAILAIAFVMSLLPMLLPQYGGCRGVQEISGIVNLLNPIGILSVIMFIVGMVLKKKILGLLGCLGIVVSEIYEFLTWHIMTVSGKFSIDTSFRFAFPEFYIGLAVSVIMVAVYSYFAFWKKSTAEEN